ncbi:exosortase [Colwellia sp. MB3u-4]|uniref:exosortase n=1 Tax=Colwellia sp. MB3u-4 TaxID=2759822 RepID=UPI0015F6802D|nr:exosortase [Colwellia sp. MB3u-4]MBA6290419.1 exosortase [Colwellia sp. MB3u-4]
MNRNVSFELPTINKPFLCILIIFTAICALNIPVLLTLWRHGFDDGTYSHAYLIPFISLYLYYQLSRNGTLQFKETWTVVPTILLLLSCGLLFITSNAQISVGYWAALLAVFITSVTMLFRFNYYIVFPAAFLIFIFPFWGVLVPLLQNVSTAAVTYLMNFTGVPTYVEGNFVTIPAGVFEIADGCSGLRYMIVSLAIGSLFVFLNIRDTKRAILFLLMTIIGALLTNWIRITALILIGEYTNMESSLMQDHNTFGWYLYVPFMIFLFWWGNKLSDIDLIASTSNTTQIENRPSYPSMAVLVLMLGLSSTTFSTMLVPATATENLTSDAAFEIQPKIHFYSFVTHNISSNDNTIKLTYVFNGEVLDGKPSYYENNLIPSGWRNIWQENRQNKKIHRILNQGKSALILVSYEINQQQFSSLTAFKIARLTMAIENINQTKLHWTFIPCKQLNCEAELQNL